MGAPNLSRTTATVSFGSHTTTVKESERFRSSDLRRDEAMSTHTDPVCGMKIDDQKAASQSTHQGSTYYFCTQSCKIKFDNNPQQYASQSAGS